MLLGGATLSGNTARFGGGIGNNSSQFDATFSTFAGNSASQDGGSIYNAGTMTLAASTLDGNMALGSGGGVYNASTLKVDATTLSRNSAMSALYGGGGIYNFGSLVAINSTLAQNQAYRDGGGIQNEGTSSIYNLTIAYNEADADADSNGVGAGIFNDTGATFNVRNSVVAENYLAGVQSYDDCTGSIGMYGNNKFSPTVNCTVAAGSPGTAAPLDSLYELGILRDNGGPTRTIALVPPSAMIDGALGCSDQNNVMLTNDQRGRQRYVGLNCDIGAFEYDADDIFASGFQ
jgi:predicted outer membrane repeat protein